MGVWTTEPLPAGLKIGPLEGRIVPIERMSELTDLSCAWEVCFNKLLCSFGNLKIMCIHFLAKIKIKMIYCLCHYFCNYISIPSTYVC